MVLGQRGMGVQSADAEDEEDTDKCGGATVARDHAVDWCESQHSAHPRSLFGCPPHRLRAGRLIRGA